MKAKKSLGQHFLTSRGALRKIIEAAGIERGDTVLEIGPGKGALTEELLKQTNRVIAVEKDPVLVSYLKEKFKKETESGQFKIVENDILLFDQNTFIESYMVIANIPYYITGAILEKFLSGERQPTRMVLMVQKEVAERIARDKKESLLSISVKVYGTPRYVTTVKRGSFTPAPKIDSAILIVENISKKNFKTGNDEKALFSLLKTGFAHKRKFLRGNLEARFNREDIETAFRSCSTALTARAEELDVAMWKCLAENLNNGTSRR